MATWVVRALGRWSGERRDYSMKPTDVDAETAHEAVVLAKAVWAARHPDRLHQRYVPRLIHVRTDVAERFLETETLRAVTVRLLIGDVRERLRELPDASVDCVVTSPPYWGLRSYLADDHPNKAKEIGLERTLGEHLDVLVDVFREARRVLKAHGTCWVNYGDCYAADANGRPAAEVVGDDRTFRDKPFSTVGPIYDPRYERGGKSNVGKNGLNMGHSAGAHGGRIRAGGTLKPKDLCMVANRLAIALQDDGWWVRSEIIWHKPNPMPESSYDRPTTAHEKIWLLTKSETYHYDADAIREPVSGTAHARAPKVKVPGGWGDTMAGAHGTINRAGRTEATYRERAVGPNSRVNVDRVPRPRKVATREAGRVKQNASFDAAVVDLVETRNKRNVWTIAPKPFRDAHFATFPPELARICMLAGVPREVCACCGAPAGDPGCGPICGVMGARPGVVLDPFGGAGTVGVVADELGVDAILVEINEAYAAMAQARMVQARAKAAERGDDHVDSEGAPDDGLCPPDGPAEGADRRAAAPAPDDPGDREEDRLQPHGGTHAPAGAGAADRA